MPSSRSALSRPPLAAGASIHVTGVFFRPETVRALARVTGMRLRPSARLRAIACALDEAATSYVLDSRSDAADAAGGIALWARRVEAQGTALLESFGLPRAPGSPPAKHEVLAALMEGLPCQDPRTEAAFINFCLRSRDWTDTESAPRPDKWEALRTALEGVRLLAALAGTAAQTYEGRKGKKRTPNVPIRGLFGAIAHTYTLAFGGPIGFSTPPKGGAPYGPGIRYARAILRRVAQRIPKIMDADDARDADM